MPFWMWICLSLAFGAVIGGYAVFRFIEKVADAPLEPIDESRENLDF